MCGIVGSIQPESVTPFREQVRAAMHALAHRGPDDEGLCEFHVRPAPASSHDAEHHPTATVLLGARRLAIIDLSDAAHQPMSTADGRFHIVFNGEIFNYRELRSELRNRGTRFHTESDTEVLLAGYEAWGRDVLQRVVGMFSFAILDSRSATLFLARDPFGIKPLYFAQLADTFLFSSEIAPLLDFPGVSRRVNPRRLYEFIRDGVTDHSRETLFADVSQLPAAHCMLISCLQPATAIPERYWTVQRKQPSTKPRDSVERFRELFKQSVRLHLRSDVPLGVSLSGGIDSSAIVAMAHFLNGNSGNLHSISYIADDPRVSEQSWCDIVAQAASLHQHRVEISASELKQDFAELVRIQEQPFGSPTIYAQYRIFRAARECGLKVMLGGHGADQYIGSYHPHLAVRFGSLMRRGRLLQAARFLRRASSSPGATGFFTLRSGMRQALPEALVRQVGRWQSNETLPVSEEWFRNHGVSVGFAARAHRFNSLHDVLALTMLETNLPGLLRFEDRNAMAFSIENRVPFLTTALVEFVFSLPEEDLVAEDGTCKSVLMRAMKGLVPEQVLARRDKLGFCMPMQELGTQLAPWMKELLQHATLIPALDAGRLLKDAERTLDSSASRFIQPAIWKWISLISWAREFNVVFE